MTLTAKPGPTLSMTWGAIAIADPWLPEAAPRSPAIGMGSKDYPTAVTVADEGQFHLDSDSSLGVFYEITDAAALQPLFEDDLYMQRIFNRVLKELIVLLDDGLLSEAQGREGAAVR